MFFFSFPEKKINLNTSSSFLLCSVAQSCSTLCDPMDYSLPDFSVHGISQARILEWVALSFSRGSSWPRNQTRVFCVSWVAGRLFITEPLVLLLTLHVCNCLLFCPLTLQELYFTPIFFWLYTKYILDLEFTLTTRFPLLLHIRKKAAGPPNCQTQLLGYWCQPRTVFETVQKEEIKTLTPLFLITGSWLWALILYKPLDFSWGREAQFLGSEPTVFPSLLAEN